MSETERTATPRPAKPRGGLGRGLSALLGDAAEAATQEASENASRPGGVRTLPVGSISPHPGQPRRHFDDAALDELARSIAAQGILQPIVVRPRGKGYQIVAGERRWRAAQRARLHEVPVIVRELEDAETLEIAIVENIQREDLNAIEEALAYKALIVEFDHSQDDVAKRINKSRSHVANLLRLLDLPDPVQTMVVEGELSMGHARALIGAPDVETLAARVRDEGLSVRDTERLARAAKPGPARERQPSFNGGRGDFARDADIAALEQQLGDVLGLKVQIVHADKGGGTMSITYGTLDQLDLVCQRLSGEII